MIEVRNLTKAFGAKLAVNDISFTVQRGEVLGFLGPNGAGKSTTMRMITGNSFSSLSFTDILDPQAEPETTGLDHPSTARIETKSAN